MPMVLKLIWVLLLEISAQNLNTARNAVNCIWERVMKISFLGLGVMGYPMAGHLQHQGYDVCVYNRSFDKAKSWQQKYGGGVADNVALAVKDADVVIMCLGRDEDVREVVLDEEGVLVNIKDSAILIDHTTTSATLAVCLAKACKEKNIEFLDAPVSGGESGAVSGVLSIMVGGKEAVFAKVKPILSTYAHSITYIGGYGDGQRCKMVNQMAIAGVLQGLSEALLFGQKAGLAMEQVITAISGGAAGSWQLLNRAETMIQGKYDFGFAIEWMIKDLSYAIAEAKRVNSPVPLNEMVLAYYQQLSHQGFSRADTSALIEALKSVVHE